MGFRSVRLFTAASVLLLAPSLAAAAPAVVGGHNDPGQNGNNPAGAIGQTRFIQTAAGRVAIYDRTNGTVIAEGSWTELVNGGTGNLIGAGGYPSVFWDTATERFYFAVMAHDTTEIEGSITILGYSKTASPGNLTTDWCRYEGPRTFFDEQSTNNLKLGHSKWFVILGYDFVDSLGTPSRGAGLYMLTKPGPGATCQTLPKFSRRGLVDTTGKAVKSPLPSNQIDTIGTGYVVARNGTLPSNKLWFYSITRATNGTPVVGKARALTVPTYNTPPRADQPTVTTTLSTGDATPSQAAQAINPRRTVNGISKHSFWTQHTVRNGNFAAVRWYEINPAPATPVILRTGLLSSPHRHIFNAAISPDRRVDGATRAFGDSFVIHYNATSRLDGISPRIIAASSFRGAAPTFLLVKDAAGPFRGMWSTQAGASPDPRPTIAGRGVVWGTNQISAVASPPSPGTPPRTQNFALRP